MEYIRFVIFEFPKLFPLLFHAANTKCKTMNIGDTGTLEEGRRKNKTKFSKLVFWLLFISLMFLGLLESLWKQHRINKNIQSTIGVVTDVSVAGWGRYIDFEYCTNGFVNQRDMVFREEQKVSLRDYFSPVQVGDTVIVAYSKYNRGKGVFVVPETKLEWNSNFHLCNDLNLVSEVGLWDCW